MRVWAIANQKGGVGKTTTTLALGRALAIRGARVLLVDLDPHASLTRAFGLPAEPAPAGVLDLFDRPDSELQQLARSSDIEHLAYLPAQTALATLERRSATQPGLGLALSNALARGGHAYDHVLFDCAPTLGLLMVNALAAADHLVIPTQTEPLALHGLNGMLRTAAMIERSRQRELLVSVLPTLHDRRTRTGNETLKAMQDAHGERVWDDAIPNDTRLCRIQVLTESSLPNAYPGRALSAYRRALDWLLNRHAGLQEQAA
ncbi:ParA family protein [Pseudoxanthomonas dokdonensis]|uniref:Plasmid partitioning protein ParA n=1 Tax=Pseudoxanthomonas dokdonensis TaxID=344882 RepID=A0A0R0CY62_9GAMM|nr:ParA family protein [Pseudoxanthomonas dokdonensis]KRG71038.1 plasmid partitioning protein ParA [Pseudoxanthomonas dokdonensis]